MKKNITINLFGRLYAIDEDAYQLLMEYEESLRSYFSKQESGGEIVNDLEARIAELMDELKAEGYEAISIEHVQNIILRIGNPKQMEEGILSEEGISEELGVRSEELVADEVTNEDTESSTIPPKGKKSFYRDVKDKKLFGVLSGCAAYFGGSSFVWRLGFVALFFCGWMFGDIILPRFMIYSFDHVTPSMLYDYYSWTLNLHWWLIPAYFIVAIIAPKAITPEDRLRMKGEAVNPETLAKEVAEESRQGASVQNGGCADGCLSVLVFFFKFVAYTILFVMAMIVLFLILGVLLLISIPFTHSEMEPFRDVLLEAFNSTGGNSVAFVIAWILVVAVPIYCGIHSLLVNNKKTKKMGLWQRIIWIVLWTVSLIVGLYTGGVIVNALSDRSSEIGMSLNSRSSSTREYEESLNDGTWMNVEDSTFLVDGGWKLLKREACHKQGYTLSGEYYTGNDTVRYLDTFNAYGKQIFRAERTETDVRKGTYTLTAVARAWGTGAFIYAIADSMLYMKETPKCGNVGGDIYKEAMAQLDSIKVRKMGNDGVLRMSEEEMRLQKIVSANNGKGYGWCKVTLTGIKSESGIISYGITNDSEFTGERFKGEWFSATDFELKKE